MAHEIWRPSSDHSRKRAALMTDGRLAHRIAADHDPRVASTPPTLRIGRASMVNPYQRPSRPRDEEQARDPYTDDKIDFSGVAPRERRTRDVEREIERVRQAAVEYGNSVKSRRDFRGCDVSSLVGRVELAELHLARFAITWRGATKGKKREAYLDGFMQGLAMRGDAHHLDNSLVGGGLRWQREGGDT